MSVNEELGIRIVIGKEVVIDEKAIEVAAQKAVEKINKITLGGNAVFATVTKHVQDMATSLQDLGKVVTTLNSVSSKLETIANSLKFVGTGVTGVIQINNSLTEMNKILKEVEKNTALKTLNADVRNFKTALGGLKTGTVKIAVKVEPVKDNLTTVKQQLQAAIAQLEKDLSKTSINMSFGKGAFVAKSQTAQDINRDRMAQDSKLQALWKKVEEAEKKYDFWYDRSEKATKDGNVAGYQKAEANVKKWGDLADKLKGEFDKLSSVVQSAPLPAVDYLKRLNDELGRAGHQDQLNRLRQELELLIKTVSKMPDVPKGLKKLIPDEAIGGRVARNTNVQSAFRAFGGMQGYRPPRVVPAAETGGPAAGLSTANIEAIVSALVKQSEKAKSLTDTEIAEVKSLMVKIGELEKVNAQLAEKIKGAVEGKAKAPSKLIEEAAKALGYKDPATLQAVLDSAAAYQKIQRMDKTVAIAATGGFDDVHKLTNDLSYKQRDKEISDKNIANTKYMEAERKLSADRAALAEEDLNKRERYLGKLAARNQKARKDEADKDEAAAEKALQQIDAWEAAKERRIRRREQVYAGRLMQSLESNGQTLNNGEIINSAALEKQISAFEQRVRAANNKAVIAGVPLEGFKELRSALRSGVSGQDELETLKTKLIGVQEAAGNDTKIVKMLKEIDKLKAKYADLGEAADKIFGRKGLTQGYLSDASGPSTAQGVAYLAREIGKARTDLEAEASKKRQDLSKQEFSAFEQTERRKYNSQKLYLQMREAEEERANTVRKIRNQEFEATERRNLQLRQRREGFSWELADERLKGRGASIDKLESAHPGADISRLRSLQQEIAALITRGGTGKDLEEVEAKLRRLGAAITTVRTEASMQVPVNFASSLNKGIEDAFQRIGDLRANAKATAAALNEAFAANNIQFDSAAKIKAAESALRRYNVVIKDGVVVAKEANNAFSFLGDSLGKMAKRLAEFYSLRYILFAVSNQFKEATTAAIEFHQNIHDIAAIAGSSKSEMNDFGNSILDIARNSRFTSQEVAELMRLLAQAGVSASQLPIVAKTVSQFATATATKPELAADLTTTALNVFDIKATETIRVTNALTAALNESKLTSQGLGTAFNYLAPQAEQLGMSLEQTLGMIANVAQAGIKPSTIGTGLSQLLKELAAPKPRFQGLLDYYSIKKEDVDPLRNSFAEIIAVFENATGKLGEQGVQVQHAMQALETRVGRALVTSMSMGSASFDQMTEAITGTNAAWVAFFKSMDGARAQMNVIKQNFQAAMIDMYKDWEVGLVAAAKALKALTEALNTQHGQIMMNITALAGLLFGLQAIRAMIASMNVTAAGSTFLSFFTWFKSPAVLAVLGTLAALTTAYFVLKGNIQDAGEELDRYNKKMFSQVEAVDNSMSGLRQLKMRREEDGQEVSILGEYQRIQTKYGKASPEAMEQHKKVVELSKKTKEVEKEAAKQYEETAKKYGATSREAMAAREEAAQKSVTARKAEAEALKKYDELVKKHGESSKEAQAFRQKEIKLIDESKVALNKLRADHPEYMKELDIENKGVLGLAEAYDVLKNKYKTYQAERDRFMYNENVGPELKARADAVRKAEEEKAALVDTKPTGDYLRGARARRAFPKKLEAADKKIADAKAYHEEYQKHALPLSDRLQNEYEYESFGAGTVYGILKFGKKLVPEEEVAPSSPPSLPPTRKNNEGGDSIPEYQEHFDAIEKKKKERERLMTLLRTEGTSLEEMRDAAAQIRILENDIQKLMIAEKMTDAKESATYYDKNKKLQYKAHFVDAAKAAIKTDGEWAAYWKQNGKKGMGPAYLDYKMLAAKGEAEAEGKDMGADSLKLYSESHQKRMDQQQAFYDQMKSYADAATDAALSAEQANLEKLISSAYVSEKLRADAIIKARKIANDRIKAETEKQVQDAQDKFYSLDSSIRNEPGAEDKLNAAIAKIEQEGARKQKESDLRIDGLANSTRDPFKEADRIQKDQDRALRAKQQALAIQKELAHSAEEVHQLELQGLQDQIDSNEIKKEALTSSVKEVETNIELLEIKVLLAEGEKERLAAQGKLDEYNNRWLARLQSVKEELISINELTGELQDRQADVSNESFGYNFKRGWEEEASKIGTEKDLYNRIGGTAFNGITSTINDSVTMLWDEDETAVQQMRNSISQLKEELTSYQQKVDAIKGKGSFVTGQDKANLVEYETQIKKINDQIGEQEDILKKQTNAWENFKEGLSNLLKDIAKEIQAFLIKQAVIKFAAYIVNMFGSAGNTSFNSPVPAGQAASNINTSSFLGNGNSGWSVTGGSSGNWFLSTGGAIPLSAGTPGVDSVPAMLMPGEVVIKKSSVDYYGADRLLALNDKKLQKFAEGGLVGGTSTKSSTTTGGKEWTLNIYNIADPNSVPKVTGEEIINVVSFDMAKKGAIHRQVKGIMQGA